MTRLLTPRFFRSATLFLGLLAMWISGAGSAHAQQACQTLRYTFQPDCLQSANHPGACPAVLYLPSATDPTKDSKNVDRLDLGPQIAVWIESADRSVFVDTLMVTNQVAARGIGNRPGLSNFVSSPKFPYGKRQMASTHLGPFARQALSHGGLPGPRHQQQQGRVQRRSAHRFSRELLVARAVLLPAAHARRVRRCDHLSLGAFNSSKGHFDMTLPKSYYPPRSDLGSNPAKFISQDCDLVFDTLPNCTVDSEKYAADPNVGNDLDAVAQATPPYGASYSGTWAIPPALAAGDYAVWVEVNKEFDSNSAHNQTTHPSVFDNQGLASYGMAGNFGQPSVVYRAPIRLDEVTDNATGSTDHIQGYSDWTGATGTIMPPRRDHHHRHAWHG